jgi:hypothetical protein
MYSFRQRPDTTVVDEPLYAHYLIRSGVDHPGRAEVLAAQEHDGDTVVRNVIMGECHTPVLFTKNMAHHLVGLDRAFLTEVASVLLVRHPREMLPSLAQQVPKPTLEGTSLPTQVELIDEATARGERPLVVDSKRLLLDPPAVLAALCDRLGLIFDERMLTWEPGPITEDGIWAPHWYAAVHASRGFAPYQGKSDPFPTELEPLLDECLPLYERIVEYAI